MAQLRLLKIASTLRFLLSLILLTSVIGSLHAQDEALPDRSHLPIHLSPFEGQIGGTYEQSEPDCQQTASVPEGAGNATVVIEFDYQVEKPDGTAEIALLVNGEQVAAALLGSLITSVVRLFLRNL